MRQGVPPAPFHCPLRQVPAKRGKQQGECECTRSSSGMPLEPRSTEKASQQDKPSQREKASQQGKYTEPHPNRVCAPPRPGRTCSRCQHTLQSGCALRPPAPAPGRCCSLQSCPGRPARWRPALRPGFNARIMDLALSARGMDFSHGCASSHLVANHVHACSMQYDAQSCWLPYSPQHHAAPSPSRAQVCRRPQVMDVKVWPPATATGTAESSLLPVPSWPLMPAPARSGVHCAGGCALIKMQSDGLPREPG